VTPLPVPLGSGGISAWRLDDARFATTWDVGEGAFLFGGRWNRKGIRAVYCSLDPGTAILEVAVHKGFRALDAVPHILTSVMLINPERVHVVQPSGVPNGNWLRPGTPGASQQDFGSDLLARYPFVLFPSSVSMHSWNLVFIASRAAGMYSLTTQESFALDTRLNPPIS